jgi:hypothetical protein
LRSIKKYVGFGEVLIESRRHNHVSRLMESIPVELPIEPSETRWEQKKNKISSRFEFKHREDVKDFIIAIQELEDRTQHFVEIKVERYAVTLQEALDDAHQQREVTHKFFAKVKEIYGEVCGE